MGHYRFGWPDWIATLAVIIFVTGFPVAMFLAWVFDWTPQGIRRDEPWSAASLASLAVAGLFLVAGSGALFWLINPSGMARLEQTGVAVLPCRYRGDPAYAFRAEGYAGILNESLALEPRLRVLPFTSVLELASRNPGISEWKTLADVTWLIECRLIGDETGWRLAAGTVNTGLDQSEQLISLEVAEDGQADALDSVMRAVLAKLGITDSAAGNSLARYIRISTSSSSRPAFGAAASSAHRSHSGRRKPCSVKHRLARRWFWRNYVKPMHGWRCLVTGVATINDSCLHH